MDPIFQIPEDLGALDAAGLQEFIEGTLARIDEVLGDVNEYVSDDRPYDELKAELGEAVEAVKEARAKLAALEAEDDGDEIAEDDEAEAAAQVDTAELEELAAGARAEAEPEPAPEPAPEVTPEPVVAAATPAARRRPARAPSAAPRETDPSVRSLVAAAGADIPGVREGTPFPDDRAVAKAMIDRMRSERALKIAPGSAEKIPIAFADWRSDYPEERNIFGLDPELQAAAVARVTNPREIRRAFDARHKQYGGDAFSLVASGGLCAPVTPYYGLQMISQASRPVRAALASFNADRGGIRAALPASLAAITTGVGEMTVDEDQAGGTIGTKTCQSVDCPDFVETDVEILFHCLRFGNLGARTFPERVAQWNNLVLAAHARLAERVLLSGIDAASTAVTAASWGLGASADLLSQVLVAAAGMRSRHRMDPDAVLRLLMPRWVIDLIVSDVYRSQFQRWDMTPDRFVSLLRAGGVEPTFYIDSAVDKHQEFGVQSAGPLLAFPSTVSWYLYPEGSFLYLDGGTLELGLVRDSVLNSTNDFEIFGESFENVAFIGVESLAVVSTVCDSGVTSGTHNPATCGNYSAPS